MDWLLNITMFCIYVLQSSKDGLYYIGSTGNLERRLWEHNYGPPEYTARKRPWVLIYTEEYLTRGEAVKRERYLKSLRNKRYLKTIMGL